MDEDSSDSDVNGRGSSVVNNGSNQQAKRPRPATSQGSNVGSNVVKGSQQPPSSSSSAAAVHRAKSLGSSPASSSSSSAAAAAATTVSGQGDIQEQEVVALISRGSYDIKQI